MNTDLEQRDGTEFNVWIIAKLIVGTVLLIKAADGYFTLWSLDNYSLEGREIIKTVQESGAANFVVTTIHFVAGGFLIWNTLVPAFSIVATCIFAFATSFELIYGASTISQVIVLIGLALSIALSLRYRNKLNKVLVGE
jgi:hypothetical protein